MSDGTERASWVQAALLDDPAFLRGIVERTLQTILEEELSAHLGAERYERSEGRRGYRNGHKPRMLTTRVGTLELLVPQDRDGTFSTELFGRYPRRGPRGCPGLGVGADGDVCPEGLHPQGGRSDRAAVWDALLQEPGVGLGRAAGQ